MLTSWYSTLDFLNRDCKCNNHDNCVGAWRGLGFEIRCRCNCHLNKKALEVAPNPATNATEIIQSPKEKALPG
jgi:hypothetical protein